MCQDDGDVKFPEILNCGKKQGKTDWSEIKKKNI
jgi:hypothetical protein